VTRRGRRDNGLPATLWSPLRDVDPRVGEHLLDVLYAAGIAAYLEPSADVGPYTRTVFLPSPPSDRLFVDRSRRTEARTLIAEHADDHPPGPAHPTVPERARLRPDLDEDAEWARIVAELEAERETLPESEAPAPPPPAPAPAPPPPPHEPDLLDLPEEHYEPPAPPPLPVPSPHSLYAFLLVAGGLVLVGAPSVLGLSFDVGLILGVAAIASGVVMLVSRMRERSVDDGDDGAVV
jgi:hypothetical protein